MTRLAQAKHAHGQRRKAQAPQFGDALMTDDSKVVPDQNSSLLDDLLARTENKEHASQSSPVYLYRHPLSLLLTWLPHHCTPFDAPLSWLVVGAWPDPSPTQVDQGLELLLARTSVQITQWTEHYVQNIGLPGAHRMLAVAVACWVQLWNIVWRVVWYAGHSCVMPSSDLCSSLQR